MAGTDLSYSLMPLTPDDFAAVAELKDLAFADKRGCTSSKQVQQTNKRAYVKCLKKCPEKLQHCRIAKESETGVILGACQLQFPGNPGDLSFDAWMRHEPMPGEAYVEFIATHPDHTGKGIGSKLLQWAFDYSQADDRIHRLSLDVMSRNTGAIRLYERKGFVVKKDPHMQTECEEICTGFFLFWCMGCRYCSLTYMEKPIASPLQTQNVSMEDTEVEREEMKRE